jgi:hypothetical protein
VDDSDLCQPFACLDRLGAVVSKQYLLGTEAPFIVGTDGPHRTLFTALDNLIASARVVGKREGEIFGRTLPAQLPVCA